MPNSPNVYSEGFHLSYLLSLTLFSSENFFTQLLILSVHDIRVSKQKWNVLFKCYFIQSFYFIPEPPRTPNQWI